MSKNITVDVAVIGAGIAGSHLAQLLANSGVRVLLIDKRAAPLAGPTWINAVPFWMFDEASLARPEGKEVFDINDRFIIRSPDKSARLTIDQLGAADIHMGLLGKRLKDRFFSRASARFLQCCIRFCRFKGERLVEIIGEAFDRTTISIKAELFVDASGMKGTIKKCHPRAAMIWPTPDRADTCTALQRTLAIRDRHGAMTFLEQERFAPGDVLSDVGIMGGYSLFRVQIDKDLQHISLLSGVRSVKDSKSASLLVNDFVAKNGWIGKTIIDGRGAIPLNAPYKRLFMPGLALLGDAACQVFAAHGSGIGFGMIAANLLAQSIINNDQYSYQSTFHRRYFQRLYFSEYFRRFSQTLSPKAITRLLASGIMSERLARQTLLQEDPKLSFSDIAALMHGATRAPQLFFSMAPTLSRAFIGKALARTRS